MNKYILLFLLFASGAGWAQTYTMYVKTKDTTNTYPISSIQKLTFKYVTDVKNAEKFISAIKTFKLLQNYPNPFNPKTTINYELPKAGQVEVKVFDINGSLVKTLLCEEQESGYHKLNWEGKNEAGQTAASGVYLCQVRFDNYLLTKKMLMIK